ncbi:hypothetical protein T03_3385 [Trichinella britovi]|uniref:Uncharacterized protein n=1 Tax=Trichinella britovi TaxID=45882 RepID=A0A0V1C700_TRIBR|nr:hypothetical protein T03_3385 [Trichinella britovi]
MEIDIIYGSNEILAADGTPIAFPTILMFFLVTQVGYVKFAHFIHDSITLTSSEFDLVPFATRVRMDVKAFPSRPSVPLLITAMKYSCTSQHFVLDSNGLRHQKSCLVAADGTQIAFLTVLMFSVTQVRNCEDESRILNDLHRITGKECGV